MSGDDGQQPWALLVEEMSGRTTHWHISRVSPVGDDLVEARAAARELAFRYRPHTGARDTSRHVYQVGEDVWLIAYEGKLMMGSLYCKVSVVRHVGSQ